MFTVIILSVWVVISAMWTMAVWESNVAVVLLQVSGVMLSFVLSIRLVRFLTYDDNLQIRDSTKCHNWRSTATLQKVQTKYFLKVTPKTQENVCLKNFFSLYKFSIFFFVFYPFNLIVCMV